MFSFNLQEEVNLSIWTNARKPLPDQYQIPDPGFLFSLQPNLSKDMIETKEWLVPDKWDHQKFVKDTVHVLPERYQIPDLTLLKRMFDAY